MNPAAMARMSVPGAAASGGAHRLVTTCPSCYHTWAHEYPRILGEPLGLEVVHATELLARRIAEGKIELGGWLLQRLKKPRENVQTWWAIGRLGAREPVYGSAHHVVPAATAEQWLEELRALDVDFDLGTVDLGEVEEECVVLPFLFSERHLQRHVERLVLRVRLVLGRANPDAQRAAGALIRDDLQCIAGIRITAAGEHS